MFSKNVDLGPFFSSQLEAPQKLTADAQKHNVLLRFSFDQAKASRKRSLLKDSAHGLLQHMPKMELS